MADVIALVHGVSTPIKLAWMMWVGWGVVQVGWYRRACVAALPAPMLSPRPERSQRRPTQEPVAQVLPFETDGSQPVWRTPPESEGTDASAPAAAEGAVTSDRQ